MRPSPRPVSAPALLALCGLATLAALAGCKPAPPPAPEGLDESTSYMIRNFYNDDAHYEAGLVGFMRWFDEEGYELVGVRASAGDDDDDDGSTQGTDAFTISDLSEEDISGFPLADLSWDAEHGGERDLAKAKGVVSVAEMDCAWQDAEDLLARWDQHTVFSDNWEGYARDYRSDRATYQAASQSAEYEAIPDAIDPFAEDFDPTPLDASMLFTISHPDPATVIGVNIPQYEMYLDFRHGLWQIDEEEMEIMAIITFVTDATYGETGENGLRQSYSVEINVERPGNKTLRVFAAWAEPVSPSLQSDDALVLNYAVNTSQNASDRMSEICSGELEVEPEPEQP
jgi:hypothetical protein